MLGRSRQSADLAGDRGSRGLDLAELRERLSQLRGPELWRSLEELADTREFGELLSRELPSQAEQLQCVTSRRRFLQLMSASLALGGLTACTRQPLEKIVPYVQQPESLLPGQPMFFATAMPLDGFAKPLLVESHMGRPTKVEGNPEHPASRGSSDLYSQASILSLYDPERSQVVRHLGRIRTWAAFVEQTRSALQALEALGGARIRILTRTLTSPSLAALLEQVLDRHERTRWHQFSPVTRDHERQGLEDLFDETLAVRYHLDRADVIVSLDADFLISGPGSVAYARDFAQRRRVDTGQAEMCRFYAAESSPTCTGTLADHRLPVRATEIPAIATALASSFDLIGSEKPTALAADRAAWVAATAQDLRARAGRSLVVPGEFAPPEVHTLAHAINVSLGNVGSTVDFTEPAEARPEREAASLRELVDDMQAGEVDILLILGGNPLFETPADVDFQAGMEQVPRRVHLGLYEDETAELCHWHIPEAHYLESWGDARAFDGSICLTQPLIEPLYGGRTASEVLSVFLEEGERSAHDQLLAYWRQQLGDEGFDHAWRKALHDGFVAATAAQPRQVTVRENAAAESCRRVAAATTADSGTEILFRPDPTVYDGCFNNNGWLQECPKPLTKLTWDNAALIAPAMAERLALESDRLVEISFQGRHIEIPVWVLPGHPDGAVTIHLGYGRRRTGRVGAGTGVNAYALRTADALWTATGATIRKLDRFRRLASTQLHHNIALESREAERRHLVRVGTLDEFTREPEFARHMGHRPSDDITLYPVVEYEGHAWGLAIDLSTCTGCNACVIACQAENNIPIVGKEMVEMGREMHWLRIDRYFQGDLDAPAVHHQPVMCMHCEQAPCEVVCPVAATVHSDEGLNDMVYNRCVGTRYCSNNCPYKVRRFNFLKYNDDETPVLKMLRNPDVTVRTRGVMEKCTYCVQRINFARIEARKQGRPMGDGDVQTACQQSCPTKAIVFGDINDPDSEVSRAKEHPLSYGILEELGTRPRTTYLAKIRNPSQQLEHE